MSRCQDICPDLLKPVLIDMNSGRFTEKKVMVPDCVDVNDPAFNVHREFIDQRRHYFIGRNGGKLECIEFVTPSSSGYCAAGSQFSPKYRWLEG